MMDFIQTFYLTSTRLVVQLNMSKNYHLEEPGPGISPSYYAHAPCLLLKENRRKIQPKEIPSCLIPCLLVVLTQKLEIYSDIPELTQTLPYTH